MQRSGSVRWELVAAVGVAAVGGVLVARHIQHKRRLAAQRAALVPAASVVAETVCGVTAPRQEEQPGRILDLSQETPSAQEVEVRQPVAMVAAETVAAEAQPETAPQAAPRKSASLKSVGDGLLRVALVAIFL